jgi:predicted glutamine amidotransferase
VCELLGITSSQPVDIAFSFSGFTQRGGRTGPHADGWGVSLFDRHFRYFARTFHEERPAHASPLARFLQDNPIETHLAVAHIRKKTMGQAQIENTHPFVRVFHGRHLVFAHNGTLPHVRERPLGHESPLGDTDSEHAFCWLLERLREAYPHGYPDDAQALGQTMFRLFNDLGSDGVFNVLLSDGRTLFARCGDHLSYILRTPPLGRVTLADEEVEVNLENVMRGPGALAVVSTTPLTRAEAWVRLAPGALLVFQDGRVVSAFDGLPDAAHVAETAWRPTAAQPFVDQ